MSEQLNDFIADITGRYPVEEIILFGSRARGDARPDSDWDIIVCPAVGTDGETIRRLLADTTLERHFEPAFLDLFTVDEFGGWDYPTWTKTWVDGEGYRGWFPYNAPYRYEIQTDMRAVWPQCAAAGWRP